MHYTLIALTAAIAAFASPSVPPSFASVFKEKNFQGPSVGISNYTCADLPSAYASNLKSFAINDGYICTFFPSASCKGGMSYSYYGDFVDFTGPQPKSLICGERNSTNENGITPPKN